jgi:hypothetical protein
MEVINHEQKLFEEISVLIEQSRRIMYSQANSATILLFWQVGRHINGDILENERADYGKQIVVTLARKLEERYGRSFEEKNLRRMIRNSLLKVLPTRKGRD